LVCASHSRGTRLATGRLWCSCSASRARFCDCTSLAVSGWEGVHMDALLPSLRFHRTCWKRDFVRFEIEQHYFSITFEPSPSSLSVATNDQLRSGREKDLQSRHEKNRLEVSSKPLCACARVEVAGFAGSSSPNCRLCGSFTMVIQCTNRLFFSHCFVVYHFFRRCWKSKDLCGGG
jgi:hypothetical protein